MVDFIADWAGPPRRRLYIGSNDPGRNEPSIREGWEFAVSEFDADGLEFPVADKWAETFEEILHYPEMYAPKDLVWRWADSNEVVNIYALNYD